jgi:NADH:ubiquinone oxidoreductase subunit K
MNLSLFLFLIGILGFILNRKNIILMIIAIEIMLLAVTNNFQLSNLDFSVDTFYQTSVTLTCILPFQITGIVDGDGSFGISIIKKKLKQID